MPPSVIYPRFAEHRLVEALSDTPVVLIHGPRQCGKTTLARMVGDAEGYDYYSFDDSDLLASATADPIGFVEALPAKVILDEVQKAPDLFSAIKRTVDRNRLPGRFILTGSANILLVPRLADSLAGRMEIIRLHPLSQGELQGRASAFFERLFEDDFGNGTSPRLGQDLDEIITKGGFPAALARGTERRRLAWLRDYSETIVQRDVRDLARIRSLDILPRLLTLTAGQTARLLNVSELASPFRVSRPTIADYVTLLERVFLIDRLPPWHSNRLSRLIKKPKIHIGDTGLAASLLRVNATTLHKDRELRGQLLETFVFQELQRMASYDREDLTFHHYRDRSGMEVDIVVERGPKGIAGVEVKSSVTIRSEDFRGLRRLRDALGSAFRSGVLLYDGERSLSFGDRLQAVPIRELWSATDSQAEKE